MVRKVDDGEKGREWLERFRPVQNGEKGKDIQNGQAENGENGEKGKEWREKLKNGEKVRQLWEREVKNDEESKYVA